MSQAPVYPLFIDAYLADTTHLSTEEHGAYLLLLMAMWRRGGSVPDDDTDNARMTGLSPRRWAAMKARLRPLLILGEGEISQKRLRIEWENSEKRREAARRNGEKGGRPPDNKTNDLGKPRGSPQVNPEKSFPSLKGTTEADASSVLEVANATLSETNISDLPKPRKRREKYPDDFEVFWTAYPTDALMSKKAASVCWARLDDEAKQLVMTSLPAFKAYCSSHPDYRPVHANRYLGQERYVGFAATAAKIAGRVFVAVDSPEWEAWQRVKRTPRYRSEEHKVEGWHFPSRWPPTPTQQVQH